MNNKTLGTYQILIQIKYMIKYKYNFLSVVS